MIDRNATLDLPCDNCGHETKLSLNEIASSSEFECSNCGTIIKFDSSELEESLDEVENEMEEFLNEIENLGF